MNKSDLFEGQSPEKNYQTRLEEKVQNIITPFQEYINNQATASIFLLLSTLIALAWASMPELSYWYDKFTHLSIGFHIENFHYKQSLHYWVNETLLTLFFFFVGLEIKREFLVGELSNPKNASLVLCSALGGALIPAAIYFAINYNTPAQHGWGIPMATDTAFALGILICFKNRLPQGIFTFLAALAIVDDIAAILIIAIFYTTNINIEYLAYAVVLVAVLAFCNAAGQRKPLPYLVIGILLWITVVQSGIHGTIAGIVVAFLIPARPKKAPGQFIRSAKALLTYFEMRKSENPVVLEDETQHAVLEEIQEITEETTTPLQRWEHKLEKPIAFFILPLFALVNAGVQVNTELLHNVFSYKLSLGIFIGLFVGKPLGVILFSHLALWFKIGKLPQNTSIYHISCAAFLTGIGFTMSLFIANLSFHDAESLMLAKGAIIASSVLSGIVGAILLSHRRFS